MSDEMGTDLKVAVALLDGMPIDKIVAAHVAAGESESLVRATLDGLLADSAFAVARIYAMRLRCRNWLLREYAKLEQHRVTVVERASTDVADFAPFYWQNRPVVIRQAAAGWPAVRKWTKDYLLQVCGSAEVRVMFDREGAQAAVQYAGSVLQKVVRFSDYLERVFSGAWSNDYYLVAKNDFFETEGTEALAADIGSLAMVKTDCESGGVKMWFGPAGTHTPLHYDSSSSILVQIRGSKSVRIVPPWCSEAMAQMQPWFAGRNPEPGEGPGEVIDARLVLGPGDALFIPVGWWHEVNALDVSISLTCNKFVELPVV